MLSSARNTLEKLMAFWPLLIILITYLFIKIFKGNVIAASSTVFIEVIRGVPLITILFLAIVMAPLFVPEGVQLKNTWSVLIGYTLFNSVYLAEVLRGGLNAIPQGQYEAADAIGLNTIQKIWFVILPQAVQMVIPALVNLFVGLFKSTSIVGIVGLFDLMGIVSSVTGNPAWQGLRTELYIFAALIYFLGSYVLSSYSQRIERKNLIKKR
jgi:general L-amino acid transport system permease protein